MFGPKSIKVNVMSLLRLDVSHLAGSCGSIGSKLGIMSYIPIEVRLKVKMGSQKGLTLVF